jgi:hypothetical protein
MFRSDLLIERDQRGLAQSVFILHPFAFLLVHHAR